MTIETKYSNGDEVFVIENNKIERLTVCRVIYDEIENQNVLLEYELRRHNHTDAIGRFFESDMFNTKEELIKSL